MSEYIFINLGGKYDYFEEEWFETGPEEYPPKLVDLFVHLYMKLAKSGKVVDGELKGFFHNRQQLLESINNLWILYDRCNDEENMEGRIFGFFLLHEKDNCHSIDIIQSFVPGATIGTTIIEWVKSQGKDIVAENCLPESIVFWEKMGFVKDDSPKDNYIWKHN